MECLDHRKSSDKLWKGLSPRMTDKLNAPVCAESVSCYDKIG